MDQMKELMQSLDGCHIDMEIGTIADFKYRICSKGDHGILQTLAQIRYSDNCSFEGA